jgi:hypothetical protein
MAETRFFSKLNFLSLLILFVLSTTSCFIQNDGKPINSADDLRAYLDKKPANGPDKPIKVTMSANVLMLPKIAEVINSAGKYVNLKLSGNVLTTIDEKVFLNCTNLTSINIPKSVTRIGQQAFLGCTNLTKVTIPNSVTIIEFAVFRSCTSLTSITIPNSVTSISNSAFNSTGLKSITIPNIKEFALFT